MRHVNSLGGIFSLMEIRRKTEYFVQGNGLNEWFQVSDSKESDAQLQRFNARTCFLFQAALILRRFLFLPCRTGGEVRASVQRVHSYTGCLCRLEEAAWCNCEDFKSWLRCLLLFLCWQLPPLPLPHHGDQTSSTFYLHNFFPLTYSFTFVPTCLSWRSHLEFQYYTTIVLYLHDFKAHGCWTRWRFARCPTSFLSQHTTPHAGRVSSHLQRAICLPRFV